jgi:uncharacterized membrane protein YagU involved in acid resistance
MFCMHTPERDDAWKNIVAATIGGLAASWVMNQASSLESKLSQKIKRSTESTGERAIETGRVALAGYEARGADEPRKQQEEPTTLKVAALISRKAAHHELTATEKKVAGPMVHYTFGALMGAWYGVLSEITPVTTFGRGALYGAVVWLGADEIALSALKLTKSPFEYPISTHVNSLGAHAAYGVSMDTIRRGLLRLMDTGAEREAALPRKMRRAVEELRRVA